MAAFYEQPGNVCIRGYAVMDYQCEVGNSLHLVSSVCIREAVLMTSH